MPNLSFPFANGSCRVCVLLALPLLGALCCGGDDTDGDPRVTGIETAAKFGLVRLASYCRQVAR